MEEKWKKKKQNKIFRAEPKECDFMRKYYIINIVFHYLVANCSFRVSQSNWKVASSKKNSRRNVRKTRQKIEKKSGTSKSMCSNDLMHNEEIRKKKHRTHIENVRAHHSRAIQRLFDSKPSLSAYFRFIFLLSSLFPFFSPFARSSNSFEAWCD